MKINCRLMAFEPPTGKKPNQKSDVKMALLEISGRDGESARRVAVFKAQEMYLRMGDKIRSLAGKALVLINPSTAAGAFILTPELPLNARWNHRTELEINEETTRLRARGRIIVDQEIGGLRGGTATTR